MDDVEKMRGTLEALDKTFFGAGFAGNQLGLEVLVPWGTNIPWETVARLFALHIAPEAWTEISGRHPVLRKIFQPAQRHGDGAAPHHE